VCARESVCVVSLGKNEKEKNCHCRYVCVSVKVFVWEFTQCQQVKTIIHMKRDLQKRPTYVKKTHQSDLYRRKETCKRDLLTLSLIRLNAAQYFTGSYRVSNVIYTYGNIPSKETYIYEKRPIKEPSDFISHTSQCRPVFHRQHSYIKCDLYIWKHTLKRDLYL